ncbi:hypothetical protein Tco_0747708 [Tanacetum coccineum]|uniref:Uncharacterized protein n=1 Tax=Tanacetum coccineum TaxID=301880 RepID=A0ABQ4YUE0_9ASTR
MDDALVPREQRLQIGSSNYRLRTTFKPKEPTFQVALDVLSLTPFYLAFLSTTSVLLSTCMSSDLPPLTQSMHQIQRTFGTIINKCLSGKVTGIDSLRLSRAQILWGLYHQMKVDYVYLLWEDLVFQIENKESRKTKYIFIPQHEVVQKYGAILHDNLTTNHAPSNSKEKIAQAPKASFGKRIKSAAKVTRSGKKKKLVEGLETLSEIALSKAEQMKLAIERSKTQLHSSQPSSSGAHERTGVTPGVPGVPTYRSDDEQISWKSSDEEDDNDESKRRQKTKRLMSRNNA